MSSSNLSALATGLVPVLFILLLGYIAAKSKGFDADQTAGFGNLVVEYTLPATLFIAIIKTPRKVLIDDWKLLLVIAFVFLLMYAVGYVMARSVFHRSMGEAAIAGLLVGSPGVPFFGTTILGPLFGASSTVTVAIMSIVVNVLQVPLATVLLVSWKASAGAKGPAATTGSAAKTGNAGTPPNSSPSSSSAGSGSSVRTAPHTAKTAPVTAPHTSPGTVVFSALRKPMVVAPVLAILLVLVGLHIPSLIDAMLTPLGQATSGVAVFVAGLTLGQQKLAVSWEVGWNLLGKMLIMPLVALGVIMAVRLTGTSAREVVVASGIMSTTIAVILAGNYKIYAKEASSTLLLTAIAMFLILPAALSVVSIIPK